MHFFLYFSFIQCSSLLLLFIEDASYQLKCVVLTIEVEGYIRISASFVKNVLKKQVCFGYFSASVQCSNLPLLRTDDASKAYVRSTEPQPSCPMNFKSTTVANTTSNDFDTVIKT